MIRGLFSSVPDAVQVPNENKPARADACLKISATAFISMCSVQFFHSHSNLKIKLFAKTGISSLSCLQATTQVNPPEFLTFPSGAKGIIASKLPLTGASSTGLRGSSIESDLSFPQHRDDH